MNAGFNAATDIFSLGADWKVKSSDENASVSTAECQNRYADVTARDQYGAKIAPTATYELAADVTSLPDLGTVVTINSKKVAIQRMVLRSSNGQFPTLEVTGAQIDDAATAAVRTYSCGTIALSPRKIAQDALGWLGGTTPDTLTDATFTFEVDVSQSEPKGVIAAHDVTNGRVEAAYVHTSGTGAAPTVPSVSGTKVVSAPATKSSPENDYVTYSFSITDSLTGTDA
ncbi:MAG: hypothetical protein J6V72_11045 [Kiritimatiellae bacterium]|nr:hypothetical protein [Kiritimatiellia bacterium]